MNKIIEDFVARPLKERDYGRYTEYSFQFQNKIREAGGDKMITPGYTELFIRLYLNGYVKIVT